jgi:hypothetical protein
MTKTAAALLAGFTIAVLGAASNITGYWELDLKFDDSGVPAGGAVDCVFQQHEDGRLAGRCMGASVTMGEVREQNVSWQFQKEGNALTFTGVVNERGTNITGTFIMNDRRGRFTASPHRSSP